MRVMVIGGTGGFGRRLVELLREDSRVAVIVASRGAEPSPGVAAVRFDRNSNLGAAFAGPRPDIIIDASGPFQRYGGDPYRIPRAAIERGIHYIDLADAAEFVAGIRSLDSAAKQGCVFAISGASTFPALSGAAIAALEPCFDRIERVVMGVAPSPRVRMGRSVIEAICSYAGKPVGRGRGLVDTRRRTIHVPGTVPLGPLIFGLVEVPDTALRPRDEVWAGAATRPQSLFLLLRLAARLVSWRAMRSLLPFAGLIERAQPVATWGEHRGGFFVEAEGVAAGRPLNAGWHLIAEGNAGPYVPTIPAVALVQRCLDGRPPPSGARAADREFCLDDFAPFFRRLGIETGFRDRDADAVYRALLGETFNRLPAAIGCVHGFDGALALRGRGSVERGTSPLSRLIAALMRFPPAADDVEVRVAMSRRDGVELWVRRFGPMGFQSLHERGRGRFEGLLCERFGPLRFGMAVVRDGDRLRLVMRRWSAFGVPMPPALAPRIDAFEHAGGGRFNFDVEIAMPIAGRIVHYRGWLEPEPASGGEALKERTAVG